MPTVRANGIDVYYETAGPPAAPPLLLIQGITGYTKGWCLQVPDLQNDFFVITFDNRGAGRSSQPGPGYSMADMGDDAAGLLDALDIPQAFVFGISMGGMIALNLALRHPAKVIKLALGCTSAGGEATVMMDSEVFSSFIEPSTGDQREDFLRAVWFLCAPETVERAPDVVQQLADVAAENPQTEQGYAGQLMAVSTHDVAAQLAQLSMPVLVMHGDKDLLVPFENGRYLAEHIPGAQFAVYPNTGHLYYAEEAAAVNGRLRSFFLD